MNEVVAYMVNCNCIYYSVDFLMHHCSLQTKELKLLEEAVNKYKIITNITEYILQSSIVIHLKIVEMNKSK